MGNKELYKYIEGCIKKKNSFLYGLGYNLMSVNFEYRTRYSKSNDFQMIFENKDIDRYFEIKYFRLDAKEKITDSFIFEIYKGDGNSLIFIDNYMLFIQKQEIKYLWLNSFEGTFEEKLDQLLDYVVDILQTYLMPILKGEEWVNVPTNWYGAK